MVYKNMLETIGNTPMVELTRTDTGVCRLFIKLENQNPGGSIKDRVGLYMIEQAEARGAIRPGDTLVEATAGNTGIGLALVAQLKGYRLVLVIPDKMSVEKINHLRSLGVEVIITRSDVPHGHPECYLDYAQRIATERNAYYINQFGNPDNPKVHEIQTAPEIWEQMDHAVDAVVVGSGSSGTLTGLTRFFKRVSPRTEIILADPEGSALADYINTGTLGAESGAWIVEGIGGDFIPSIADFSMTRKAYTVTDRQSIETALTLLRDEGIMAGSSTGTLLHAAVRYCREQSSPKRVVTIACDTGNKYLSKMYDENWRSAKGFSL